MKKLWLWKNFVDDRPEYWAFDNPYPCHAGGDPMTLGEPCGYAIFKKSTPGRTDVVEAHVIEDIKRVMDKARGASRPSSELVELAKEMDLTLAGGHGYNLTISSGRVHRIVQGFLNIAAPDWKLPAAPSAPEEKA